MKTIKLFLVAMIATFALTASSCSNSDDSNSISNKVEGTTWTIFLEKAPLISIGNYTLDFQKGTNICTMKFNRIVKNEEGVTIINTTVTKTGTYNLDDDFRDRGSIIFPDIPSNKVSMYFSNGVVYNLYVNNELLPSGIRQNHLEVSYGKDYDNGAGFKVLFMPNTN